MATESTRKDNRDTPPEEWIPVGYDAIEED
jgi:hypothetical protein